MWICTDYLGTHLWESVKELEQIQASRGSTLHLSGQGGHRLRGRHVKEEKVGSPRLEQLSPAPGPTPSAQAQPQIMAGPKLTET